MKLQLSKSVFLSVLALVTLPVSAQDRIAGPSEPASNSS
jgi:hypothetical protein